MRWLSLSTIGSSADGPPLPRPARERKWLSAFAGLLAAFALAGCAREAAPALPSHPVRAGSAITVEAQPVPQFTDNRPQPAACADGPPSSTSCGGFTYAGGLALTSPDTSRLHGLSDLKVWPDGRLLAMGDEGDMLQAQLALAADGRPRGLTNARLSAVDGEDGQPLPSRGKEWSDAEGIAELANGDRLVSLEEHDRILIYPHGGGAPRLAPSPDVKFPFNSGMEALAAYPAAGPDAYIVGGEASGELFICHLAGACAKDRTVQKPLEFGLTAVAPLPGGRLAYLLRAYDPLRGARAILRVDGAHGERLDEWKIERPATVDNFEGLAAVPRKGGIVRFYLISDDNFSSSQRTLLLAFDWKPSGR